METASVLKLLMVAVCLVLCPGVFSHPMPPVTPRPLCTSQLYLANHACAMLPFTPIPPPSPPGPSPKPPSLNDARDGDGLNNHHHHHHHHHHHRRRPNNDSPVQRECCRWLNEIDDECVCDLLVHLPPFLSRPVHNYTVIVSPSCNVTYTCSSRIQP